MCAVAPDKPASVTVKEVLSTVVFIEVVPPQDHGGMAVSGYRIDYNGVSKSFDLGKKLF